MDKFNNGKPFNSTISGENYTKPHGRDSVQRFTVCPYGKSKSLPFCDGCGQHNKNRV
jgi:hypothetical protein